MDKEKLVMVGSICGGVVHDINNLLMVLMHNVSIIQDTAREEGHNTRHIDLIEKMGLQIKGITKQLLSYFKETSVEQEEIVFSDIVNDVFPILKIIAPSNVLINMDVTGGTLINGNSTQINQLLINLCKNSIEAMPEGGTLTIRVIEDKENVTLLVQDTGIGMSEELQKTIFNYSFTTKKNGTGIGLSSVMFIANEHHAKISVESKVGKGTNFKVTFQKAHKT